MSDKTHAEWDNSARWYDENMGEEGDALNSQIIRPRLLSILGNIHDKIILDAGCGSGYVSVDLAKSAKQVVGTDFSDTFIKVCKSKYSSINNLSFEIADVTKKLPFNANKFNVIISKMVLQYVSQINIFAKESFRITKKRGELIICVDHPFHTQYYFAQQEAGKPNPKYPKLNNYFSNKKQTKLSLWGKVVLTWYPKTISQYILPFIDIGWKLTDLQEPPETIDGITLPRILMLKSTKE